MNYCRQVDGPRDARVLTRILRCLGHTLEREEGWARVTPLPAEKRQPQMSSALRTSNTGTAKNMGGPTRPAVFSWKEAA